MPSDDDARVPAELLDALGVAVVIADADGRVHRLNRVAGHLTGWRCDEAAGRPIETVVVLADDLAAEPGGGRVRRQVTAGDGAARQEAILVRRTGERVPVEYAVEPLTVSPGRAGIAMVLADLGERRLLALRAARVSHHDPLTGLLNRRALRQHLAAAIERRLAHGEPSAVVFLDLDQFRLVNATCGHDVGDDMLGWVAAVIREVIGERDAAARMSGDEFAVLLADRDQEAALAFAHKLGRRLREFSFTWDDRVFSISGCAGVVPVTAELTTADELLSAADHACSMAKDAGRGRVRLYESHDIEISGRVAEMEWAARIDRQLSSGRTTLHAQPIRRLRPGPPRGLQCEVLLRVDDPDGRASEPGQMIRAAERYGIMPTIDRWVVRTTMRTLAGLGSDALRRLHVAFINLSGLSLQDERVLDEIRDELSETGVPPNKIGFEVTETAAVQDLEQARWFLQELGSIGCRLSLDDFGTGVASYSYLKALPVDFLKIDGGFVEAMTTSALDRAMVESINQVSHVLGMETVAESVGTPDLLQRVREIGVDHAQGYWIGVPRPLATAVTAA